MPRSARRTGLRAEEQGLTPPVDELLPADFSGDDVLVDDLAEAGEIPQVDFSGDSVHKTRGEAVRAALSDPELTGLAIHESESTVPVDAEGRVQDTVAVDVRTDGFFSLRWHGTREWPIGLRLGKMAREAVRGVSGELTEDEDGLIAWFQRLPGEVNFRDGTRVVLRYQMVDGYVVDVK